MVEMRMERSIVSRFFGIPNYVQHLKPNGKSIPLG